MATKFDEPLLKQSDSETADEIVEEFPPPSSSQML